MPEQPDISSPKASAAPSSPQRTNNLFIPAETKDGAHMPVQGGGLEINISSPAEEILKITSIQSASAVREGGLEIDISPPAEEPVEETSIQLAAEVDEGGLDVSMSSPAEEPAKATSAQPTHAAAPQRAITPKPQVRPEPELKRSLWGDRHAARERLWTEQYIEVMRKFDPEWMDDEYAAKLMEPWQEKGVLERKVPWKYLDPDLERDEIMDLKTAQAIARKKDAEAARFLKRWSAGEVDDWGRAINGSGCTEFVSESEDDSEDEHDSEENSSSSPSENGDAETKDAATTSSSSGTSSSGTSSSGTSSSGTSTSAPRGSTPTINPLKRKASTMNDHSTQDTWPSAPSATSTHPLKKQKTHHMTNQSPIDLPLPSSFPSSSSPDTTTVTPTPKPKPKPTARPQTPKPPPPNPTPLPGLPTYDIYNYTELAALCNERNIMTGGNTQSLRARLIQDDINIVQGLPRDAKNYTSERKRGRKTVAPVVPGSPIAPPAVFGGKRKRGDSEEKHKENEGIKKVRFE